jgi:hypothetical protein
MEIARERINETIILTAAIDPSSTPYVGMPDPKDRLFQYLCSLVSWIQLSGASSIIFCENTGYSYSYTPLEKMAEKFGKKLEILTFKDNAKSSIYGKGWGEGRIIEYIFENSILLRERPDFYKITGRYFLQNFDEFSVAHRNHSTFFYREKIKEEYSDRLFRYLPGDDLETRLKTTSRSIKKYLFYVRRGQWFGRPDVDHRVVTYFFKSSIVFFEKNLLNSYRKAHDRNGYILEKVYCDAIKDREFLSKFLVPPRFVGRVVRGKLLNGISDYDDSIQEIARGLMES